MPHAICTLASIPLRKQPDLLSEMTSQLLFGDHYEILDAQSGFQLIRLAHDGYEGWITARQGEPIDPEFFQQLSDQPAPLLIDLVAPARFGDRSLHLVRGSHLPAEINGKAVTCEGQQINVRENAFTPALLERFASEYLHAPYHWGGRSPFGIDCSGFTQIVFKLFDIPIPRDSQEQAKAGKPVSDLNDSRPGDLAFFFENTSHVGLITSTGILHASSAVRHDDLDEYGIRDRDTGTYTHQLTSIRSLVS